VSRPLEEIERDRFLAEAESLAQIVAHPAWGRFEELLVQMRLAAMEHMAQATPAEFPYWQGVVATLREIKERPHQIVAAAHAVLDEENARKKSVRTARDLADRVTIEDDL
jgi:hypothetical protein